MDCGAGQRLTCSAAAETAAPLPSVSPIHIRHSWRSAILEA